MQYLLITGITGAVGSEAAVYFSSLGYKIIGVGRKKHDELGSLLSFCDDYFQIPVYDEVNSKILLDQLIEKKYPIKAAIFFNGGFDMDSIKNFSLNSFNQLLQQNYLSTVMITKYILSYFHLQGSGSFIFTSAATTDQPERFSSNFSYTATKTLINHLASALAHSEAKNDIRVAVLKPTIINTEANQKAMPQMDTSKWISPISICEKINEFLVSDHLKYQVYQFA